MHCIRNVIKIYGRGSEVHFDHDEALCGCLWGLTEVIPDTETRCDLFGETPVQFDAVYCVMKK